jgi:hypothetical protein
MGKSLIPKGGSDLVMTPDDLAQKIVGYFNPFGKKCLEPCKGDGAFVRAFEHHGMNADWCEIIEGRDFFDYTDKVDYIITNPPYSILSDFLEHALEVADNVVLLVLGNAMMFKKRLRLIKEAGCGFKEFIFVDTPPPPWPQFGIQLAVVHIKRGYNGDVKMHYDLSRSTK